MTANEDRGAERFPTTHWSLVARAGSADSEAGREALGRLLTRYLPALRAHLIYGKRLAPDRADDMVQEFVANKILEKDLIARADQNLGKFRTFLLTALDRFVLNRLRDERAKKRAPSEGLLVEIGDRADLLQSQQGPSEVFDVAWARGVLAEALRRMQEECETLGRTDVWGVFECRVVAPTLQGAEPADYQHLIDRFGFKSPVQASNVLITAKRMYARTLRSVVGEYALDNGEIESEIRELREILSGSTA